MRRVETHSLAVEARRSRHEQGELTMNTIRGTFALAVLLAAAGCVHGAADRSTDPSSARAPDPVSVAMVPVAYDAGARATAWDAGKSAALDGASTLARDERGAKTMRSTMKSDGGARAYDAGF
jgi:hypothetical protein